MGFFDKFGFTKEDKEKHIKERELTEAEMKEVKVRLDLLSQRIIVMERAKYGKKG